MRLLYTGLVVSLLIALSGCSAPLADRSDRAIVIPDTGYASGPATRGGTGRFYMGREIARVMGPEGAAWLERPDRDEVQRPEQVVDSLYLQPDDVVADIGAGTGYFTLRLAARVPDGLVYAVDIQPEMLDMLEARLDAEGIENVATVIGAPDDPRLLPESVDVALIVDAYHEFAYPREMLQNIRASLVPGGRLVLIEYRTEDPKLQIHPLHRMSERQTRRELEANGFRWLETKNFLPMQHFLVFER
jgi:SAM-dependent methyltransferase